MSSEIIRQTLDSVRQTEKNFSIAQNMISVDAPDGGGKSTFSRVIEKYIKEKFHFTNVLLVSPTKFGQSQEAVRLENELNSQKNIGSYSWKHNAYFMGAMASNYREIINPALRRGGLVILDSSEIRSIAYMLDKGDKRAIKSTLNWIKSGRATNNTFSGTRVILNTKPEDCIINLRERNKVDIGDPKIFDEAARRCECYQEAVSYMKEIQNSENSIWININNPRYESTNMVGHILNIIEQELEPTLLQVFNSPTFVKNCE